MDPGRTASRLAGPQRTDPRLTALQRTARRRTALSTLAVSGALVGANGFAYVFTVLGARLLTPAAYGELAALLGVLLVGVVPATGLAAAGALAVAGRGPRVNAGQVHTAALITAGGVGLLAGLAAPLLVVLLHLPDPASALWVAAVLVPHTLANGYGSVLQGERRFGRLAAVTVAFTAAKATGAIAGLLLGGTVTSALAGMAAGVTAGAAITWLGCGAPRPTSGGLRLVRAGLGAAGTLLGFTVLVGLDLVLARHWLSPAAAGAYAVGSIVTKITYWLPQGIGVMVLPRLAEAGARRRALPRALTVVCALGLLVTAALAVTGDRVAALIGGDAYGDGIGGPVWLFAALGTLLAVAQLLIFSAIATGDRVPTLAVWLAVAVEIVAVAALDAVGVLTGWAVVTVAAAVVAALAAVGMLRRRRGEAR